MPNLFADPLKHSSRTMSWAGTCKNCICIYQTICLCIQDFTHRFAAAALECTRVSATLVPRCVSVCQCLWFGLADWGEERQGIYWGIFFLLHQQSWSLWQTPWHSDVPPRGQYIYVCVCVLCQSRAAVVQCRQKEYFSSCRPGQWRKWDASGNSHAFTQTIEVACFLVASLLHAIIVLWEFKPLLVFKDSNKIILTDVLPISLHEWIVFWRDLRAWRKYSWDEW